MECPSCHKHGCLDIRCKRCSNCLKAFDKEPTHLSVILGAEDIRLCADCIQAEARKVALFETKDLPGLLAWYKERGEPR
jgi:hypothetical protein